MVLEYFLFLFLVCALPINGQEIDLKELANTLSHEDIPVRLPKSRFVFNKNRKPGISKRILGGNVAVPHAYPYQVAMYVMIENNLFFCGGSLITPEWVLTAAHCVESASYALVILGSHNLNQDEPSRIIYNTSQYIIHENWDSQMIRNDIALIKLPENVTLNTYIGTVPIACGNKTYAGLISRCLGWGKTVLGSLSSVLRYVDAVVMTNEGCSSYNEDYGNIINGELHLCTSGEGYIGSCNGDSGGPLIINGTQVGIVSFGDSDCSAGSPSVYTRLTNFYMWVNDNIEHYNETCESNANGQALKLGCLSRTWIVSILSFIIINFSSKWIS